MKKKILIIALIVFGVLLAAELIFLGGRYFAGKLANDATEEPTETTATVDTSTEAPTEEPTEAPTETTEAPTVYCNPLTGEVLEEPMTNRIFAVTINNIKDALPHVGVNDADIYFEMYVNDYATRGLALYTDIARVDEIGSVRSIRYNFTDIAVAYDAFVAHAGGSEEVLADVAKSGIDHKNIDTSSSSDYSFRSTARNSSGIGWVHCLMVKGGGLYQWAQEQGYATSYDEAKDYGLLFTENGAPAGGEDATTVSIDMSLKGSHKNTTMVYDADLGEYVYNEYGETLVDGNTGELESFKNVFVIMTEVKNSGKYHVADLQGSGEGYYACDGKLIPILWHHEAETDPFTFTLTDGTPLEQGIGNSYVAIAPLESEISWK